MLPRRQDRVVDSKYFNVEKLTEERNTKLTNEYGMVTNPVSDRQPIFFDVDRQLQMPKGSVLVKFVRETAPKYVDIIPGKVTGTQTFRLNTRATLPTHMMCRWIIRVE